VAGRERRGSGNACVFVLLKAQGPRLSRPSRDRGPIVPILGHGIAARKERTLPRAFATGGDGGGGGEREVYAGKTTPAFRRSHYALA